MPHLNVDSRAFRDDLALPNRCLLLYRPRVRRGVLNSSDVSELEEKSGNGEYDDDKSE